MTEQTQTEPTPEQLQQVNQVSQAGAQAAANADNPQDAERDAKQAMRKEAERVQADIPEDVIEKVAKAVAALASAQTIEDLRAQGAFEPAPEPVKAPEQETAPPPPGETQAVAQEAPRPVKQTWADKFLAG